MSEIVKDDWQITLPETVRRQLGIVPGMAVEFETQPDGNVLVKKAAVDAHESRFAKWRGTATAGLTTDEIMAMTRGEE